MICISIFNLKLEFFDYKNAQQFESVSSWEMSEWFSTLLQMLFSSRNMCVFVIAESFSSLICACSCFCGSKTTSNVRSNFRKTKFSISTHRNELRWHAFNETLIIMLIKHSGGSEFGVANNSCMWKKRYSTCRVNFECH
jgi:hypothetical protein